MFAPQRVGLASATQEDLGDAQDVLTKNDIDGHLSDEAGPIMEVAPKSKKTRRNKVQRKSRQRKGKS